MAEESVLVLEKVLCPEEKLQARINKYVRGKREAGILTPDQKTAWLAYDFNEEKKLVSINSSEMFQCASMVKPFFMLAFFHEAYSGRRDYDTKTRESMEKMIRDSGNTATADIVRELGGHKQISDILIKNYPKIFKNTRIIQDPTENGEYYENKSCGEDYLEFLKALFRDNLPYAGEMKRLMSLSKRNCLTSDVNVIPEGASVLSKTGSNGYFCGDMGILYPVFDGKENPYAFIGLMQRTTKVEEEKWWGWLGTQRNVIRKVSGIVFEYLQEMQK